MVFSFSIEKRPFTLIYYTFCTSVHFIPVRSLISLSLLSIYCRFIFFCYQTLNLTCKFSTKRVNLIFLVFFRCYLFFGLLYIDISNRFVVVLSVRAFSLNFEMLSSHTSLNPTIRERNICNRNVELFNERS